jgi:PqqD family protein of HPr-rel-A system
MSYADRLANLSVKDDGFLFDPTTGDTFVANPTALAIVRTLQDGGDEAAAVAALVTQYEVTESEARRDVADLCVRLKSWQLL